MEGRCFNYGQLGHFSKFCPQKMRQGASVPAAQIQALDVTPSGSGPDRGKKIWFLFLIFPFGPFSILEHHTLSSLVLWKIVCAQTSFQQQTTSLFQTLWKHSHSCLWIFRGLKIISQVKNLTMTLDFRGMGCFWEWIGYPHMELHQIARGESLDQRHAPVGLLTLLATSKGRLC